MEIIDLSSDNVTQPTPTMCEAMQQAAAAGYEQAEKAVLRLEGLAANLLGKEAALLMPTGTQANLVAILCQAERGQEVIMGPDSHIFEQELGGAGLVGGVMIKTWPCPGIPPVDLLRDLLQPAYRFATQASPKPALVCFENTHNAAGGAVISPPQMRELCQVARESVPHVHLDGARICNAAAALGTTPAALAAEADTVILSLDKCLSAPYGAVLCGPAGLIAGARLWRRMLGGLVRKIGILAAAGVVAFEQMVARVAEDNARAASLGRRLSRLEGISLQPYPVPSNLIMIDVSRLAVEPAEFVRRLEAGYGVRTHAYGRQVVRLAVHRHISAAEERAIADALRDLVQALLSGQPEAP